MYYKNKKEKNHYLKQTLKIQSHREQEKAKVFVNVAPPRLRKKTNNPRSLKIELLKSHKVKQERKNPHCSRIGSSKLVERRKKTKAFN